ncbi:MAG: hypothetical protein E4H43_03055 [Bacteroidia bacterium]|nr:MAG: hypothetical protein E4H43_03055 [Bacteroidia bacterium]
MRQKVEPVISFFSGSQVQIFRKISKKIDDYKRNIQFLSGDARLDVAEIESILGSDEPYTLIKLLPQLEGRIEASLADSLSGIKEDIQAKLQLVKDDLEKELASHDNFTDEFKQSVKNMFNDVERNVINLNDCAFVKLQSGEIDALQRSAYERIKLQIKSIRDKGKNEGYDTKGLGDESNPVTIINNTALFKTKKNIETEEELNEYLDNLRTALMAILKENRIKVL